MLLPRIAAPEIDLDEHGVTVCPIHGTHFGSYVAFLRAIGTPYAVITDGDPEAGKGKTGAERAAALAKALGEEGTDPEKLGIFCGDTTFEADLFDASWDNDAAMLEALQSFQLSAKTKERLAEAHGARNMTGETFLAFVGGLMTKGRFAQRLASSAESLDAPEYVDRALKHLLS